MCGVVNLVDQSILIIIIISFIPVIVPLPHDYYCPRLLGSWGSSVSFFPLFVDSWYMAVVDLKRTVYIPIMHGFASDIFRPGCVQTHSCTQR